MASAFLFDLDMTLVDSSALAGWRALRMWSHVRTNLSQVRAFSAGAIPPHELPGKLKAAGHSIGIVTSSPKWYAEAIIKGFRIAHDVLVAYGDTEEHKPDPAPINKALEDLGVEPEDAYHIGDAPVDTQASFHAGVTSIGAGWGVTNYEALSSAAPDILLAKPAALLRLSDLDRRGYLAEVLTSGGQPKVHYGSTLPCGPSSHGFERYALGRYFTRADPRHALSALSNSLLVFKNTDSPAEVFAAALTRFLRRLDWTPDYVVPVPPKPSQTRNRFEVLLGHLEEDVSDDTKIALDGLECVKEIEGYKSMGALERAQAVRDAFHTKYDWGGASVLLVDDVLTTGHTVDECARVLSANGVGEVRIVALGKDQQVFARKECPACGRSMRVRTNSYTGERFWGCSGYPDNCQHTENM